MTLACDTTTTDLSYYMGVPERYSYQFRQYIFILITRLLRYALHYRESGELLMNQTKQYLRFGMSLSLFFSANPSLGSFSSQP